MKNSNDIIGNRTRDLPVVAVVAVVVVVVVAAAAVIIIIMCKSTLFARRLQVSTSDKCLSYIPVVGTRF